MNSLIKVKDIKNCLNHIDMVINNIEKKKLLMLYRIADFTNKDEFI
jgi:hypothetical protein